MEKEIKVAIITGVFGLISGIIGTLGTRTIINNMNIVGAYSDGENIEANTTEIQSMYNDLQVQYNSLETQYRDLKENFDLLETQSKILSTENNTLKNTDIQANSSEKHNEESDELKYMFDIVPAYESNGNNFSDWAGASYYTGYAEFASSKAIKESTLPEYFIMSGEKYYDGCYWQNNSNRSNNGDIFSLYNLNGQYKLITGTLGHVDKTAMNNSTLFIFIDGKLVNEIPVSGEMVPKQISIDVDGGTQLKISLASGEIGSTSAAYGFGNVTIE